MIILKIPAENTGSGSGRSGVSGSGVNIGRIVFLGSDMNQEMFSSPFVEMQMANRSSNNLESSVLFGMFKIRGSVVSKRLESVPAMAQPQDQSARPPSPRW